jgi:RNA polymerase sigma-B factor
MTVQTSATPSRHPVRRVSATRVRRRLTDASDRARAQATVPRDATARHCVAGAPVHPAVDLDVWTHHVAYARRRHPAALEWLVDEYRGYAISAAKRHYRNGEPLDDLVQVALESLIRALDRFDPDRRTPFLAFARPTIDGTLRRHFRDAGWSIRVPRRVHELASPIREATEWLGQDLGREPTVPEIADFLGVSEDDILETEQASRARRTAPVEPSEPNAPAGSDPALATVDRQLLSAENHIALAQCLDTLPADDRALLHSYFVERRTQSDIADELGCSQMQVSRLLDRVVRQLRARLVET